MKILFIDHTGQIGGAELFQLEIAKHYPNCLVATFEEGPFVEALREAGVSVKCLEAPDIESFRRTSGLRMALRLTPSLISLLKKITSLAADFDIIYANSKKAAPLALIAGKLARKPVFVHIHDILDKRYFSWFSRTLLVGMTNLMSTTVVANSLATAEAFVKLGGTRKKLATVNNGFDPQSFDEKSVGDIEKLRQELDLSDGPILGCIGRISEGKGQSLLLDAAMSLPPNVQVLVVGAAPFGEEKYMEQLQKQADLPLLAGRVKFTGFRTDVSSLIQLCDIIVHPAIHPEAFGRTLVEAQLAHRPVIATSTGGIQEIITDRETGLLCNPGDVDELRERICELLDDANLRQKLVAAGYKSAINKFSLQQTYKQFDEAISRPLSASNYHRTKRQLNPKISGAIKNIVFFDHTAQLSGGELAMLGLIRKLDQTKFSPTVVLGCEGPLADELRESGAKVVILPLDLKIIATKKESLNWVAIFQLNKLLNSLVYAFRLAKLAQNLNADLIHTNSLKADVIGGLAGKIAGIPVIWHVRDLITKDYLPETAVSVFKLLARILPTFVIGNSNATLRSLSLENSRNSQAIYSGIELNGISTGVQSKAWLSSDCLHIGLIGRLSPWKGQHVFIRAAALVHKAFPNVNFQIIGGAMFGEHEYERELRAMTKELNLENCVQFTGHQINVQEIFEKLDIVAHASTIGEPFGRVIVEGMAHGKPVIATDGGGVPEVLVHNETGLLVRMNDHESLAKAMIRVIENPDFAMELGRKGKQRAMEAFSVERTTENVAKVYAHVLHMDKVSSKSRQNAQLSDRQESTATANA